MSSKMLNSATFCECFSAILSLRLGLSTLASCVDLGDSGGGMFTGASALPSGGALTKGGLGLLGGAFSSSACGLCLCLLNCFQTRHSTKGPVCFARFLFTIQLNCFFFFFRFVLSNLSITICCVCSSSRCACTSFILLYLVFVTSSCEHI